MEVGGTQNEVFLLCKQLKKMGHDLTIGSNGGKLIKDLSKFGINNLSVPYKTGRRSFTPISIITFPYSLFKLVRIIKYEQINLIHSYAYFLPILLGCFVSKILKIPFITTINDGVLDNSLKLIIIRDLGILKCAKKIIIISEEMNKLLLIENKYNMIKYKTIIIPNMVDLQSIDSNIHNENESKRFFAGYKKIIWISRLDPDKIDPVINLINSAELIIKKVPNIKIIIVGRGSKYNDINKLAEKINKNIGAKIIILTGFYENIISLMKSGDIIIGMAKVVIEAMACRKAVLVVGHIIGLAGGNFGGIVTKKNISNIQKHNYSGRNSKIIATPNEISEACIKLLTDETYRLGLGEFGRTVVEHENDSKKITKQIERLYTDVLLAKVS